MEDALNLLDGLDIEIPDKSAAPHSNQSPPAGELAAADPNANAQFFGPYQLIEQVGAGGVAKVFRARHIHPGYADKTFAIKILHEELSRDPRVVDLFRHEAYVLSLLKHPNVVETFEAGSQDDKLFIAMEYIDGRDLDHMMQRCPKMNIALPIPVVIHIIAETLRGLTYAHALTNPDKEMLNLVHQDINPANVFLSFDGRVKLGDFGVASITAGHLEKNREIAGKAGYFAPEQLLGEPLDQRADLFAMGVMMFEMLCGRRLFEADSVDDLIKLNKKAKIPPPSKFNKAVSKDLEQFVLRALQRKPADRFANTQEMLAALQKVASDVEGMPLAVAALMRKSFLNEHMQELRLREGLAGQSNTRGSGQLVALCSPDERAQAAFNELLVSRGYRVEVHARIDTLRGSFAGEPPAALLIDVCGDDFPAKKCRSVVEAVPEKIPVVAFADELNPVCVQRAGAAGAVDLLFKPYNIERVLTAMHAAITGEAKVADTNSGTEVAAAATVKPKTLLLSQDDALIERMSAGLKKRGYEVEVSPSTAKALERTLHASFDTVMYDAHPACPADRFFASHFRGQAGMGLVPILYLAAADAISMFEGVDADRSAVRPRNDPPAVCVQTLNRLRDDTRQGRTFTRFTTRFPVEIRYGGRVFSGASVDISRGGIRMSCEQQMPPVGTSVGLRLRLPTSATSVQVSGRVSRVDLPTPNNPAAKVGVAFESFAAPGETELIRFLAILERQVFEKEQQGQPQSQPPPIPVTHRR